MAGISHLFQLRTALLAMAALGAVGVLYVISSAARNPASLARGDLAAGAMADFTLWDSPRPAPETPFQDANGRETTLGDFRGDAVLVNLWATWCKPCIEEMPALNALQKELGAAGLRVVAVSIDQEGARVAEPFLADLGADAIERYYDRTMGFARGLKAQTGVPLTVLYDPLGREVGRITGAADWDSPEALTLISAFLPSPS